MADRGAAEEMHVIARSPFELYYDGTAHVLSAANRVGQFDILPGHADFFSMLEPGEIIIDTKDKPITFVISNGILTVRNNEVYLFANM
jgi:F0F1-type ATP synthase epsilon subunit